MGSAAVAGHGSLIAMELDPSGAQGTFTTIAELNGDITWPELSRGEAEATAHQDTIDYWVPGSLRRGPLTFSVNFVYNNQTHDDTDGVYAAIIANETRGFRLWGPAGAASTDEWIASGFVQAVTNTSPVREGVRTADITVRLSGPQIIDGVTVGS